MANSANQLFKDDEDERVTGRPSDDQLRHITGINHDDEAGMEDRAQNGSAAEAGDSLDRQERNPDGGFFRSEQPENKQADKFAGRPELQDGEQGINPPGGLFKREGEAGAQGLRNRLAGINLKSRKSIAGIGISLLLGGGGFFGIGILSGPAMLIQVSHVLQKTMDKGQSDTSNRSGHLFRYFRALRKGDITETRVGRLGSSVFGNTMKQLKDIGIEFDRGISGKPTRTYIDTKNEKLREQFPETEKMSPSELTDFYAKQLGLTESDRIKIDTAPGSETEGRITIDQTGMNMDASRALTKSTIRLLNDGIIGEGLKVRYVTKMFNEPNMFHQLNRKTAQLENKVSDNLKNKVGEDEEAKRKASLTDTAEATPSLNEPSGDEAEKAIEDKSSGLKSTVLKAMTYQAGACFAQDIAKEIPALDRAKVVLPAIAQATSLISIGEQIENGGSDVTNEQLAAVTQGLFDQKGNSVLAGQAMKALEGDGTVDKSNDYYDISPDQKQAFKSHDTANMIYDWASGITGGKVISKFTCNSIVLWTEAGVALVFSAASAIGSGGTLTPAIVGFWAFKAGLQVAATAVFMHYLQSWILDSTTAKALAKSAFSGPLGGSLLAYGARAASVAVGLASGGIDLGAKALTLVDSQQQQQQEQQWRNESFASRLFNVYDYHSLAGQAIQNVSPSASENASSFASSVLNVGSLLSHAFASLIPKTSADGKHAYDWGFSQVGLPDFMLNDPRLADPYDNAGQIVSLLNANNSESSRLIDKAKHCFGDTISKDNPDGVWDVTTGEGVDPQSDDYQSANCNPFNGSIDNDVNWARMIMFVFDTQTMKAVACYQGDETSCSDLGAGGSSTDSGTPPPTTPGTYKNPLRGIKNIVPERIDGGVDYNGDAGPIYAVGDGVVKLVETAPSSGWPGQPGAYIMYQLTDGKAQNKYIYMAEDCTPTVKTGQKVTADTVICNYRYKGTAMEMGWSDGTNNYVTDDYRSHGGGFYASNSGQDFSNFLFSLGA
ncbi:MAG TPA: M23 family metallopeptidase, partial [Candidatus Saccharimonadales bacterium]|nr:M23 family metallopeptidase [Candidatus Saccharimonadales bacterium]